MLAVIFSIFISFVFAQNSSQKSLENSDSSQHVPFYKSTTSQFESGYASLEHLQKNFISAQKKTDRFYKWKKLYFGQSELQPIFPPNLSRYVIENSSNLRLKIVATDGLMLTVLNEISGNQKKILLWDVHADAYDLGVVQTVTDAYLREGTSEKAKILTTISRGVRLEVHSYHGSYALVKYQSYTGYLGLSDLITKFDFASFIFADNEWQKVKARQFDQIITVQNQKIPLKNVKGLITPDLKGIIAGQNQKIPLWSQVEVRKEARDQWNLSKLKDHGLVWWKEPAQIEDSVYTTDDLLKLDVSSVSFHPQNPFKGILSADGVFITQDGKNWRKLKQFEKYNGPVHYFNDLMIFVGGFRSTDGGKSFENYIQSDKLAAAIENQYGFYPRKVQVKKIETRAPYKIKLEIETGLRKIKMESPLFAQDWKATRI